MIMCFLLSIMGLFFGPCVAPGEIAYLEHLLRFQGSYPKSPNDPPGYKQSIFSRCYTLHGLDGSLQQVLDCMWDKDVAYSYGVSMHPLHRSLAPWEMNETHTPPTRKSPIWGAPRPKPLPDKVGGDALHLFRRRRGRGGATWALKIGDFRVWGGTLFYTFPKLFRARVGYFDPRFSSDRDSVVLVGRFRLFCLTGFGASVCKSTSVEYSGGPHIRFPFLGKGPFAS